MRTCGHFKEVGIPRLELTLFERELIVDVEGASIINIPFSTFTIAAGEEADGASCGTEIIRDLNGRGGILHAAVTAHHTKAAVVTRDAIWNRHDPRIIHRVIPGSRDCFIFEIHKAWIQIVTPQHLDIRTVGVGRIWIVFDHDIESLGCSAIGVDRLGKRSQSKEQKKQHKKRKFLHIRQGKILHIHIFLINNDLLDQ